ncbi:Olfactory receptor 52M1 [Camelus dromedarius]|uniref:Olfactory receptor 52M1 n=1 Tax=Camelus dromedarius TaxID=9838 RepID=A0A5N4DL82_CAMDR|nr:Olfactory receptor 52M1 [Camelus dromedarius]
MFMSNNACSVPTSFWLTGIPGLESLHLWLSIPFSSLYLVAVVGNVTILASVKLECSLHQPMYFFLCMLAVIDLVLSTSTMPKMLAIFWLGALNIDLDACLAQMFFIHCFATVESGIFLAMAFDHYVAICDPLHHTSVLTHAMVGRLGLAALLRGVLYIGPLPLMIRLRLPLYRTQITAHSCCEHMALVTLARSDTTVNNLYGMGIGFLVLILDSLAITASYVMIFRAVMGMDTKILKQCELAKKSQSLEELDIPEDISSLMMRLQRLLRIKDQVVTSESKYGLSIGFLVLILDLMAIAASYVMIFRAVMGLATPETRLKTLGLCGSHICAILTFHVPIAVSSLIHQFGHQVPPPIHTLLANFYLLIPPILNPIVYAVHTKQIQERLLKSER